MKMCVQWKTVLLSKVIVKVRYEINELNVSSSAFYVALVPVFSVASAILLIGEQPNALQWIGAVLVLTSSYFANKLKTA